MVVVPKLRFPEFSGEWEDKRLGQVAQFLDGRRIPLKSSDRAKRRGPYPYYGASGIIDYIDDYIFDEELVLLAEDGANILTRSSRLAFLARGKYWVNNHAHVIKGLLETNQYFLCEQLERVNYAKYNTGTAQPKLNNEVCQKIPLKMPKIEEQGKIASFLSKVDEKIDLLEKNQELWETYKKGMMQQIFSQKLRFKDENGEDYPDWEEKKLGEIAKFSKGKGISKDDISNEGFECIRYGELYTTYKEKITTIFSKTSLKVDELVFSQENDIIIPTSGETAVDIATASCVMKNEVAIGGDTTIIKTKENGLFLSYYLNSQRNKIARLAQGVSVVHLYSSHLKELELTLPNVKEQIKIASFLSAIEMKIEELDKELEIIKEFKKGLLQQMFC